MSFVCVRYEGLRFFCQQKRDEMRWKCGHCMRGIILPTIGYTCAVCGAVVIRAE